MDLREEGRFSGSGFVHSSKGAIPVEYSIEVRRERHSTRIMGGSHNAEGLLDMTGVIRGDHQLFDLIGESHTSLEVEDKRRIGMLVRNVDLMAGEAQIVMNGGWLQDHKN